jgi:hypothetical protein
LGLRLENKPVYSRRAKKNFWARPGGPESQNFPSRRNPAGNKSQLD